MRLIASLFALSLIALPAHALERDADGFFHTGEGVRVKKIAFVKVKVYSIDHFMKDLPTNKSKQAVIDANVDKRFSWRMLRSVDGSKIQNALREAYAGNGYGDEAKIAKFVGALSAELKEGQTVSIKYDAARKLTTIVSPSGTVSVPGEDFMRATWSIWFGKIDQPSLGDSLLNRF
jgi:hypothetical protein